MGMYDDYKMDEIFRSQYPHGVNNDEWTTKEGKVLKIKDMTNAHIRNCMRMIGQNDDFWYAFEAELKRRGEPVRLNDCVRRKTMNKELQLRAAALRWSQTHDDCADAHDACPVRKECSRYIDLLCSPRAAADLIESLAAELEDAKHEASQLRRELSWDKFSEAMGK